ncbi:hypothetical protein LTR37_020129 [Vermiconidia calcicola]|uniref:Uncharacterized protein n=1 Tax=Vermiconidia calcicola TaxID=1690605 RepID=A0ACC3MC64_9PEZI|nr:hypothetical protein LTR37_020129 [Vermiconidia calcicola]
MEKAAQRNAAREARLAAPSQTRSGLRTDTTPSPAASEGSGALPFSIPLQPAPKAGRSMSHSQGQREVPQVTGNHTNGSDHATVLPLGLLAEEVDTELESELGGGLTHTTSHPPIGSLQRTSTYPSTYDSFYPSTNGKGSGQASGGAQSGFKADRAFGTAFADLTLGKLPLSFLPSNFPHRRLTDAPAHLQITHNAELSGRHISAGTTYQTSTNHVAIHSQTFPRVAVPPLKQASGRKWAEEASGQLDLICTIGPADPLKSKSSIVETLLTFGEIITGPNSEIEARRLAEIREQVSKMKPGEKDDQGRAIDIPNMYKVPYIKIDEHERTDEDRRVTVTMAGVGNFGGAGRPRKQLFIVSFKCSRVDVFYLLEGTGLFIKEGDIVIVEADRGQDLGTVQHANITPDEARLYKRKYGEEQYKWLMMFSKNNNGNSINPNAQVYGENNARTTLLANAPATMQGLPRDNFNNIKPKAIKRLASSHEIRMLSEKEGNEAKAKRACQQKVAHLHLDMEILDAEWQWDFQKLIFYYYADHYINFKDLITELYRIYKTRIWLSAINPASFSQHALGQPPSGIGPGAVVATSDNNNNSSYTMAYGADPDPYGAVPPYRIGYDTYTPNYPGIPGVANSFAPSMPTGSFNYPGGTGEATPAVPPGVTPTGTSADYGFYYDRTGREQVEQQAYNPFAGAPGASAPQAFYGQMFEAPGDMPTMPPERQFGYGYNYQNQAMQSPPNPEPRRQQNRPCPIGMKPKSNSGNTWMRIDQPKVTDVAKNQPGSTYFGSSVKRGDASEFVPGSAANDRRDRGDTSDFMMGGPHGGGLGYGLGAFAPTMQDNIPQFAGPNARFLPGVRSATEAASTRGIVDYPGTSQRQMTGEVPAGVARYNPNYLGQLQQRKNPVPTKGNDATAQRDMTTPTYPNIPQFGSIEPQRTAKDEVMQNYLAGLSKSSEDFRADEMSRER